MRVRFKSSYDDDINLFEDRGHLIQYGLLLAAAVAAPWLLGSYYLGELTSVLIWALRRPSMPWSKDEASSASRPKRVKPPHWARCC